MFVRWILPFYYLSKCLGLAVYTVEQSSKLAKPFRWLRKTIDVVAVAIHVILKSGLIYVSVNASGILASTGIEISDIGYQIIQIFQESGTVLVMLYWIVVRHRIGELVREFNSVEKMVRACSPLFVGLFGIDHFFFIPAERANIFNFCEGFELND